MTKQVTWQTPEQAEKGATLGVKYMGITKRLQLPIYVYFSGVSWCRWDNPRVKPKELWAVIEAPAANWSGKSD